MVLELIVGYVRNMIAHGVLQNYGYCADIGPARAGDTVRLH
jgi:hypothetical protein